jgi:hypothetical protein
MKKTLICLSIALCVAHANDYQQWLQSQQNEYKQYKKSLDEEFTSMLKKQWEQFETMTGVKHYEKPKPTKIPVVEKPKQVPQKEIEQSVKVKLPPLPKIIQDIEKEIPQKEIKKQQLPKIISKKQKETIDPNMIKTKVDFFNQNMTILYDRNLLFSLYSINKNEISKVWEHLSTAKYKNLIEQIKNYSNTYDFNDWATYKFINQIGQTIYKNDQNKVNLLSWFILTKMGYDTKVGYSKSKVFLLAQVKENLYQVAYFYIDKKKYFVLTPDGKIDKVGAIFTYASDYPDKLGKMKFDMSKKPININTNIVKKELQFKYNNLIVKIPTEYSKDLVAFYKSFPQSEYELYLNSQVSTPFSKSLLTQLKPLVEDKTELEAVNFLLRFVQTTFQYKTDQENFKYEKVLFPEETIHYRYSDCEDRSILFSYLVKNLLGLDVVGLKYPDHFATAVAFSTSVSGAKFQYKNKHFTVADPTYINANAGMSMPKYKNSKFELIRIN